MSLADGIIPENAAEVWNNTPTATLEDYQLASDDSLFYTPEALNSQDKTRSVKMVDYEGMVKNETMQDVILYLVGRSDNGIAYPSVDRFFNIHKATEKYKSYNIKLVHETRELEESEQITSGPRIKKGPNWKEPKFVSDKKYEIV